MIRGIGVDTTDIARLGKYIAEHDGKPAPFYQKVFTEAEKAAAPEGKTRNEYFAVRFAAKEAVFKAVAHLIPEKYFDLRIVETLVYEDGCPYVNVTEEMAKILAAAEVDRLHISATTECGQATVFVIAEKTEDMSGGKQENSRAGESCADAGAPDRGILTPGIYGETVKA